MTDQTTPSPSAPSPHPTDPRLSFESISPATSTWSLLEAVAPENQMPVRDSCWTKLTRPQQKRSEWTILESDLSDVSEAISRTASRLHGLNHERHERSWMYASGNKEQKRPRSGSGWMTVAEYSWGRWETSPLETPANLCRLSIDTNSEAQEKVLKEKEDRRALERQLQDWGSDWTVIADYQYDSRETSKTQVSQQPSQRNGKAASKKLNPFSRLMKAIEKMNMTCRAADTATNAEENREQQDGPCEAEPQPSEPITQQRPSQADSLNQESPQLPPLEQHSPIQQQPQTCREQEQQSRPCEPYQTPSDSASGQEVF